MNRWHLPDHAINQPVFIEGIIDSVPTTAWHQTRFQFLMKKWCDQTVWAKIILSIRNEGVHTKRETSDRYHIGQRWRWLVVLKHPKKRHFSNGFDYTQWLFFHGIRAIGVIQRDSRNQLLGFDHHYFLSGMREKIHDLILMNIHDHSVASFISAVSVGLRGDMRPFDWKVYQNTGTNHLIAIAGLHIGFVAIAVYALVNFLWRRSQTLLHILPAMRAAQLVSFVGALSYVCLSGFALPAQRASIMMLILMGANWFYRPVSIWHRFCLAFLLVVLWDPTELFSASIWLSFTAVALLAWVYFGRLRQPSHWAALWKIQLVLSMGLLPITLWFFQQASFISFLCNCIAIPWVGFIILPLTCIASLFYLCGSTTASQYLFWLSGWCLWPLWHILKNMAYWPYSNWHHTLTQVWMLILCLLGIFLLLLPRGFPAKWLGFAGFLPIIFDRVVQ